MVSLPYEVLHLVFCEGVADQGECQSNVAVATPRGEDDDDVPLDSVSGCYGGCCENERCRRSVPKAWYLRMEKSPSGGKKRQLQLTKKNAYHGDIHQLDLSFNSISSVSGHWASLCNLQSLNLSCNLLGSAFEDDAWDMEAISQLTNLESLNLSGNKLRLFPKAILTLRRLRELRLGGNRLSILPAAICQLGKLEILYVGGNDLAELPAEIGLLECLRVLYLGNNKLSWLPAELTNLSSLVTLDVHGNQLESLPGEIMSMAHLEHLSVRENPLVSHFAMDANTMVPTLLELAAGAIVTTRDWETAFNISRVPCHLVRLLQSSRRCDNPACSGVYFEEYATTTIQLRDFCGNYRIPFALYVCSTSCPNQPCSNPASSRDADECAVRRVLIGQAKPRPCPSFRQL